MAKKFPFLLLWATMALIAITQASCIAQEVTLEPTNSATLTSTRTEIPATAPFPTATYSIPPSPTERTYLTVDEVMIVRSDADYAAPVIAQIPPGNPYLVLGRHIDWFLIELDGEGTGWVYGATGRTQFSIEQTLVPTIAKPYPIYVTPTPLCTPQQPPDTDQAVNAAQSSLITFFDLISNKEYDQAAQFYGGDYGILWESNPLVDPYDYATLFQHACEINGYVCLPVKQVIDTQVISPYQFGFLVEFSYLDGSLFVLGPCCGGNETD